MENEFLPYELAVEMKSIGFDEPCLGYYYTSEYVKTIRLALWTHVGYVNANRLDDDLVTSPLYQQAFRWFREKHNLRGFIGFRPNVKQFDCHIYDMSLTGKEYVKQRTTEEYNKDPKVGTYEEAELECLKKLIEIIKTP
jgi:hypothetical protein